MDVEGSEFEALDSVPDSILCRFEQIVFEVHAPGELVKVPYRRRFVRLFTR
jgi:hypothetical protein